jgi:hypothetical protein
MRWLLLYHGPLPLDKETLSMPGNSEKDIPLWVAFNPQKEVGLQAILNAAWGGERNREKS